MVLELPGSSYTDDAYSEAPMDAPSRVFQLIQLGGDWLWRLDIKNDDGLIGRFGCATAFGLRWNFGQLCNSLG
jgi:hypothetical protein